MDRVILREDMWLNVLTAPVLLVLDLEVAAMTASLMLSAMLDHMWLE